MNKQEILKEFSAILTEIKNGNDYYNEAQYYIIQLIDHLNFLEDALSAYEKGKQDTCDYFKVATIAKLKEKFASLEKENRKLKELAYVTTIIFEDGYDKNNKVVRNIREGTRTYKQLFEEQKRLVRGNGKLNRENYDLKKQLHELPKKICDEIRKNHKSYEYEYIDKTRTIYSFNNDVLDHIQAKYEVKKDV